MRFLAVAFATGLLICSPTDVERLTNATLGLSIERPDDWCNLSESQIADDHRLVDVDNAALADALRKYSGPPVFAFFRCRTEQEGVAATVKVGTEPADPSAHQSGQDALRAMLRLFSKLVGDVNVATAPETVTLAGKPSGYMALTFTLKANGKPYSVASEMWAIPQGKHFILVGATYPPNDKTDAQAAVMKIVTSLQLTH